MIINLGDAPFKAFIKVTYYKGTCTVTGNGQSYTHSGGGTVTFTVKKKGTYTVKAVCNSASASSAVTISARGETKSVTLTYTLTVLSGGLKSGYSTSGNGSYASNRLNVPEDTTQTLRYICITPAIDTTPYKTLTFKGQCTGGNGAASWLKAGLVSTKGSTSWVTSAAPSFGSTSTHNLSLASINGSYFFQLAGFYYSPGWVNYVVLSS